MGKVVEMSAWKNGRLGLTALDQLLAGLLEGSEGSTQARCSRLRTRPEEARPADRGLPRLELSFHRRADARRLPESD